MRHKRLVLETHARKSLVTGNSRCLAIATIIISVFITSCEEEVQPVPDNTCMTILLGDKDGFGIGLTEKDPLMLPAGTSLPVDYRSNGDPWFTDIYPADMGASAEPAHQIQLAYEFEKPSKSIVSAKLKLMTLGIQDGDSQVVGSNTDIVLYLDNLEVPGAFDLIDQFDLIDGSWSDVVSSFEIKIPPDLFTVLLDGKTTLQIDILQLNPSTQSYDAFAIDYCELEICFSDQGFK